MKVHFCLFVCLDFLRIFHSYGDVTITGEGLINFTYAGHLWPLSSEISLACHPYYTWHGALVYSGHLQGPMTITSIAEINVLCKPLKLNHTCWKTWKISFLAQLSWNRMWTFLVVRRLSVRLSLNFSQFYLLFQDHWFNFKQLNLAL